ncbi:MAG: glycosyltransferase family 4 protein [Pseudomonadota bacterium]
MTKPFCQALLAVPGSLATPTGGYGYARRLLAEAKGVGLALRHWPLPDGFPNAPTTAIDDARARLASVPEGWPVVVDGLALGVLPPELIAAVPSPVLALCHHPLGLESGLDPVASERLIASETAALAGCAGVITTSRSTASLLTAELGISSERIAVALPGTDRPEALSTSALSTRVGTVHILAVGSLTYRKGHDILLSALQDLSDLDWRLTIAGPPRDPAYAQALHTQVNDMLPAGRVRLAGSMPEAELDALYADADIFALASRFEGYGMAYTEAMVHGLPVVGCDVGAVSEATAGGATLVPPDNPAALVSALRPLIADPQARRAAAALSKKAATALPTWSDTASSFRDAIALFAVASV